MNHRSPEGRHNEPEGWREVLSHYRFLLVYIAVVVTILLVLTVTGVGG